MSRLARFISNAAPERISAPTAFLCGGLFLLSGVALVSYCLAEYVLAVTESVPLGADLIAWAYEPLAQNFWAGPVGWAILLIYLAGTVRETRGFSQGTQQGKGLVWSLIFMEALYCLPFGACMAVLMVHGLIVGIVVVFIVGVIRGLRRFA